MLRIISLLPIIILILVAGFTLQSLIFDLFNWTNIFIKFTVYTFTMLVCFYTFFKITKD